MGATLMPTEQLRLHGTTQLGDTDGKDVPLPPRWGAGGTPGMAAMEDAVGEPGPAPTSLLP